MKTARQVAVEGLVKVNVDGAYSQIVWDQLLKKASLEKREKAFASALFYGVLERKLTLDYFIAPFLQHKLKPVVLEILRVSFYQILYMPSVPGSAVVNEAVKLTKTLKQPGASSMVNGILRNFIRSENKELPTGDTPKGLSVTYSCPEELIKALNVWYGKDSTEEILKASLGQPETYIRVNTLKTTEDELIGSLLEEGITVNKTDLPNCLSGEAGAMLSSPLHSEGYYHIQDRSSQKAVLALELEKGQIVLDLCAAPGSKSFTIAEEIGEYGSIISCDIHEHKIALMTDGANRLGIKNLDGRVNDATILNSDFGKFSRVLCDVPCSGLGIIRRKPEIKYKPLDSFKELPELQYKILKTASNYIEAGGIIVYSTCTINPKENQKVVEKFLGTEEGFTLISMETILPNSDDGDGFFIATIRRN